MKRLTWYVGCCLMPLFGAAAAHASPDITPSAKAITGNAASLGQLATTDYHPELKTTPMVASDIAQAPPPPPTSSTDSKDLQNQLDTIKNSQNQQPDANSYQPKSSPAFAIFNPVGFGADKNLVFFSLDYQSCTRGPTCVSDGGAGIGIGLGDATNSIGAEVSYALNSFGSSAAFGSGAFSGKLHKRVAEDTAVAVGWNQFAKVNFGAGRNGTSSPSDYPNNSYYLVGTKILRTVEDINQPFSRVAFTAGVGSGVFVPYDVNNQSLDRGGIGLFGSVGVRVARPISAVVEWTGQDLAAGVSIAPFDNFPLVITPAVRDITGIPGQSARFVISASAAFNF